MIQKNNVVTISVLSLHLNTGQCLKYGKTVFSDSDCMCWIEDENKDAVVFDNEPAEVLEISNDTVTFYSLYTHKRFKLSLEEIPYAITNSAMLPIDENHSLQVGDLVSIELDRLGEHYLASSPRTGAYETSNETTTLISTKYATIVRSMGHDQRFGDAVFWWDIYTHEDGLIREEDQRYMIRNIEKDCVTLQNFNNPCATIRFTVDEFLMMNPEPITT